MADMANTPDMTDKAKSLATQGAPWRKDVPWQLLAVEGAVALGIGIYVVVATESATDIIRQLIAVVLLVQAFLHTGAGFKNRDAPTAPFHILRGGIGMTVGVIVLLENFSDYLDADAARFILGLGLVAYGGVGIAAVWVDREASGLRIGGLAAGAINIVLGLMFVFSDSAKTGWVRGLGFIVLIAGIVLLGFAFMVYRSKADKTAPPPAAVTPG